MQVNKLANDITITNFFSLVNTSHVDTLIVQSSFNKPLRALNKCVKNVDGILFPVRDVKIVSVGVVAPSDDPSEKPRFLKAAPTGGKYATLPSAAFSLCASWLVLSWV